MSRPKLGSDTGWRPTFDRGLRPAVALVAFFAVWAILTNGVRRLFLATETATVPVRVLGIVSSTVQIGATVWILRREGADLEDLGASGDYLPSAAVAAIGITLAINVLGAALLVVRGQDISVALYPHATSPPENLSLPMVGVSAGYFYLLVGPAEELAFRGYLQNKLVAVLGGIGDRARIAVGIVGAALAFALLHIPLLLVVGGAVPGAVVGIVLSNVIPGILFGILYESTRNLYLVAFVHGFGDFLPVFVEAGGAAWPARHFLVVLLVPTILVYRRWAKSGSVPNFWPTE